MIVPRAWTAAALGVALVHAPAAQAGREPPHEVEVRAYVNDSCVVADEPFFVPVTDPADTPKFLPLIGLVVGKLAELFINHEIQGSADRIKSGAARKDTRYAVHKQMNLYRATFDPAPELAINAALGCMTIVAADAFKPEPAQCKSDYHPKELARASIGRPQPEWKTTRTDDSVENQLRRADICVIGSVRAVYEARFEFSKDFTAFRLKDAGYRIQSLLTTQDKAAARTTVYTLKISTPGATDQQEVLTSAWVNIGAVTAGKHSDGGAEGPLWWQVPPLSVEARRKYDADTRQHQEVIGELEALKRAHVRNERELAGLDQRIAAAGPDIAEGLRQERLRIAVQDQAQGAEIDARTAEYQDLPRSPMEFMPVSIEVAVTETESEDKARLALADIIGKTGDTVASAVGGAASGALSKSLRSSDLKTEPGPADAAADAERARADYFDALVSAGHAAPGSDQAASERRLAAAKQRYNESRRSLGLEPIK